MTRNLQTLSRFSKKEEYIVVGMARGMTMGGAYAGIWTFWVVNVPRCARTNQKILWFQLEEGYFISLNQASMGKQS